MQKAFDDFMRKEKKNFKNKDKMKLTDNHLDKHNFWHFPKMKIWWPFATKKYKDVMMRSSLPCFAKIEHENNGNHSKKKHEDDDVTCKMTKPCESSLGMVWWKPTCAPKKWEP